jgi:hypothetical protein
MRTVIGAVNSAPEAVPQPRRLGNQLVETGVDVVGELDLGNRPQTVRPHPDGDADDPALGDRRVENACRAVLGL